MFKLSQRSLDNLNGVDPRFILVVKLAIIYSEVDFGVNEGLRSQERQAELFKAGKSQTMRSKHLEGKAVDLVAYRNGKQTWDDIEDYDKIAKAMKRAATELGLSVIWGCAWPVRDIRTWGDSMKEARTSYTLLRESQGRKPFLDGPHFEIE